MEELVDLVDLQDRVVGRAPRSQVRTRNLLHRGVGILCRNARGEVYLHRRTHTKDVFPHLYDMFVGGVVGAGESYPDAAAREVAEELGIRGVPLEFLFAHLYQGPHNRAWVHVFQVRWEGPVVHQESEIEWGAWVPEADLEAWCDRVEMVPDGLEIFRRYLELTGVDPTPPAGTGRSSWESAGGGHP